MQSLALKVGAVFVVIVLVVTLMETQPKLGGAVLFILVFALLARGFRSGVIKA